MHQAVDTSRPTPGPLPTCWKLGSSNTTRCTAGRQAVLGIGCLARVRVSVHPNSSHARLPGCRRSRAHGQPLLPHTCSHSFPRVPSSIPQAPHPATRLVALFHCSAVHVSAWQLPCSVRPHKRARRRQPLAPQLPKALFAEGAGILDLRPLADTRVAEPAAAGWKGEGVREYMRSAEQQRVVISSSRPA